MTLSNEINNLPAAVGEGSAGHLGNHRVIHEALKAHDADIQTAMTSADTASATARDVEARVSSVEAMGGLSPESPVDGQTANLVAQSDTLTSAAVGTVVRSVVYDVAPTGTPEGDKMAVIAACQAAHAEGRKNVSLADGHYQLDGVTVTDILDRYLVGDNVTFTPNSWVYPFTSDDLTTLSATRGKHGGRGRIAIEVDDALLSHWTHLFPVTKRLGITVGTAWHTGNGAQWVHEAYRHGWEIMDHHPENITSVQYLAEGRLDQVIEESLQKIEAITGTRDGIGFVYPQHGRSPETDRVLSKYYTRGRGGTAVTLYSHGVGTPWLTNAVPFDNYQEAGKIKSSLKRHLQQVASTDSGMVIYFHMTSSDHAEKLSALEDLVTYSRQLGIDIVNPNQIWASRNLVHDPYFENPDIWNIGSNAQWDENFSYHGGRSLLASPSLGNTIARVSAGVSIPYRPGMFGVYRSSIRYYSEADMSVTSPRQGFATQLTIGERRYDGASSPAKAFTVIRAFNEVNTTIPASDWGRVQDLVYIGPEVARLGLGVGLQNAVGDHPLWVDEFKFEHVDWVSSVTYEATLSGTNNVWVSTGVPRVGRYEVQVIPETQPAGTISVFPSSSGNVVRVTSDSAEDVMKVKIVIHAGSSFGASEVLSSEGA